MAPMGADFNSDYPPPFAISAVLSFFTPSGYGG